jgi:hypothetical protein
MDLPCAPEAFRRGLDAGAEALAGGNALTRSALTAVMMAAIGAAHTRSEAQAAPVLPASTWTRDPAQRLARRLVFHLVGSGVALFGPLDGREQLLVLADEWVGQSRREPPDREAALVEVATRFVRSHGPVTDRDLARWSGRSLSDARLGLAAAGDRLTKLDGENGAAWWIAPEVLDGPAPEPAPSPDVRLLPAFDEHILGYGDRSAQLDPVHEDKVCPGRNGMFKATVTLNGKTVGTWSGPGPGALAKLPPRRPVPLNWRPFNSRAARTVGTRALSAAAQDHARFHGRTAAEVH